ncbi:MAG TPA: pyridoxal-phosphate dependent enzyme [Anaerolineales bacterium]
MIVNCLHCGRPYPEAGTPYSCPNCGGLYDFGVAWTLASEGLDAPGLWRHAASLGVGFDRLTLGEGDTPLVSATAFGRQVYFKCEFSNPTGSFKDRGAATLVAFLRSRGVQEAIEDSSGNAGAAFAAYAACAGIKARVFVPETASGPKRRQIELYGAEVVPVPGPRSNAAEAARRLADTGVVYASHAYLPFNLPGYATCALEIVEQLGRAPAAVVVPAGQGGLLLGLARGFMALAGAGRIQQVPAIIGLQAAACAPLVALYDMGIMGLSFVTEGPTVAEGVRVRSPLRAQSVVETVRQSGGRLIAVEEAAILPARDALARLGFYVEPTSALVWHGLREALPALRDPVVAILSGSGYKVRDWAAA